jgi:putative phosphoesterase
LRVAALYDIHGNLPALDAVLAEVDADVVVVGGDFVAGPWPAETLERLRGLAGDVRFIRGNADREVVQDEPGLAPPQVMDFVRARLSPEQLDFLRSLPLTETIGRTLFCHATPRNDEEIFTELTPDETVAEMFASAPPVTVVGHTHMQVDRRVGDRRIVNSGSVGLPYEGRPGAYWTLLGDDVEFRRTVYDVDELVRRSTATGVPVEFYRESLIEPESRAAVAEFFEGVAGRSAGA